MLSLEAFYALSMLLLSVFYTRTNIIRFGEFSIITKAWVYVTWFLLNVTAPGCLVISAVFWAFIYQCCSTPSVDDGNAHALNVIVLMADLLLSSAPFRLLHIWCLGLFGVAYMIMTTNYFEVAGAHVYDGESETVHRPVCALQRAYERSLRLLQC
jgi:hypothetical protein